MHRAALAFLLSTTLLTPTRSRGQFPAPPGPGLPETVEAIEAARVSTRILYVTAHPDDESAAVLTYLARGLHAEVALLSLTRGEGGQNALGPEQAPQLGLIRTQELLAATRGYGVKLYFTRAKDFGFSKTPEETEKIWGDAVMQDMVRVIREFRPNIVINGWGGVRTGHGHHQTSGIWTPQAVKLAADPKYAVSPAIPAWDGAGTPVQVLDIERGSDNPKGYVLPVDEVSPLYGKSWRQMGLDAFVNHRTQGIAGFINSPFLRRPVALLPDDGSKLDPTTLAVRLTDSPFAKGVCGCGEQLKITEESLEAARMAVLMLDWPSAVASLVTAEKAIEKASMLSIPYPIPPALYAEVTFLAGERRKLNRALALAAGVEFTAEADRADIPVGDEFTVTIRFQCRPGISCAPAETAFTSPAAAVQASRESGDAGNGQWKVKLESSGTPKSEVESAPNFDPPFDVFAEPEPQPILMARQKIQISGYSLPEATPVSNTTATSTSVSRIPIRLVPAYTLKVEPTQAVAVLNAPHKPFDVYLRVHSYSTQAEKISVGLETQDGFTASAPVELTFHGIGDQYAKLTLTPPANLAAGTFTMMAFAKRGNEKFSTTLEPLPTMPIILWSEPAETMVHAFEIDVPANLRVGYISAEGEPIPDALKRLGISVTMIDPTALTFGDLSSYDTIVVGVRAYELRPELAAANSRLLEYVSNGGTLVVQYNRDYVWNRFLPAPYKATIGNPTLRTTDEKAEVKFLKPDDRLLNWPNKITDTDFQGWVQERGLYYWGEFDSKYTPLLTMHDPGEKELNGSLVYTRLGKGVYIYTGLAFFRELPEGVPGAYRLFVNLLSASRAGT